MKEDLFRQRPEQKILIVDDSVENLQLLTGLLKDEYRIKIARDGRKALELLKDDPGVQLILMDIVMPEMDGISCCRAIKSNPLTAGIPVIFLTALNEITDEKSGFNAGGSDFITKPFNSDIVKARIRTHMDLQAEKQKSDELLRVLLPDKVIESLKKSGYYTPELHPETSILFCDMVGFTSISAAIPHEKLISELTDIFTRFDEIVERNGAIRIKTIGDAYMACAGIGGNQMHADMLVKSGLEFIDYLNERNGSSDNLWQCRIGINSGAIISGIVGKSRFQFDVMGDPVNVASRAESNGIPMKVTITAETMKLLNPALYKTDSLGNVYLKGKGEMELFTVSIQ